MNTHSAKFIMLIITIFWGSSYLFMKMGSSSLEIFNLVSLRFLIAFFITLPFLIKRRQYIKKSTLLHSLMLGILLILLFASILKGLQTTSTTNAGFLVSLTVVFVPLLESFHKRLFPNPGMCVSIILAFAGIALLTIKGSFIFNIGDILCILAAFFNALHILYIKHVVESEDSVTIGILHIGFAGGISLIISLLFESFHLPHSTGTWVSVLALGLLCSAFGYVMQPVTQKYISPITTGLIFTLEPVFAAIFGVIFENDVLSLHCYLGALLILIGIIFNSLYDRNNTYGPAQQKYKEKEEQQWQKRFSQSNESSTKQ